MLNIGEKKTYIIKGTLGSISNSKYQYAPSITMVAATKLVGVKETNLPKKRAKKTLRVSTLVARNLLILQPMIEQYQCRLMLLLIKKPLYNNCLFLNVLIVCKT